MWKSLSSLLLTLYFSGVPSVALTRGTPDASLAPADSLSQAQLEGGQREDAQLEGGQLETVTVSATPFRGSLGTTTGSLSYLSTEQLRAGPQTHIQPLLQEVAGLQMQSATRSTARLTLRGMGSRTPYASNRVKAYFNDIPLTSGDGATIIEDLELSTLQSVEVLKGPASALYGPALGGVIVLRTSPPTYGSHFGAELETGSFNSYKTGAQMSWGAPNHYLQTALHHQQSEGYRQNSSYRRNNLLLEGGLTRGRHHLALTGTYTHLKAHIPSSVTYDSYQQAPQNAAANWLEVAGHQRYHKILGGLRVRSQWTRNLSNKLVLYTLWKDAGEVRPFNHLSENTLTLGFKNQLQWTLGTQRLMAGVELFRENYRWQTHETLEAGARGNLLSDNQEARHFINLQVHAETRLGPRTLATAGLNLHHLQYRQGDQQQDGPQQSHSYRWVASPRLGLNHRIRKGLYLHSSAAHGFSAPTSEETLLPDGSINRDLQPEQGYNVEIGLRAAGDKQGWQADVTAYHLWVRNLLRTRRSAEDVFYGENAGKTRHSGLESQLSYQLLAPDLSERELSLTLTHTYMHNRFVVFEDEQGDHRGNTLPAQPAHMLHLKLQIRSARGAGLQIRYHYDGRQYLNDTNNLSYPGHHLLHLHGDWTLLRREKQSLKLYAGMRNLGNSHYAAMLLVNAPSFGNQPARYYYPGEPRNFYLGLRYQW